MPSPNIPGLTFLKKKTLPLLDSQIGAFESPLFSAITYGLLLYQHVKNEILKGDTDHSQSLPSN